MTLPTSMPTGEAILRVWKLAKETHSKADFTTTEFDADTMALVIVENLLKEHFSKENTFFLPKD